MSKRLFKLGSASQMELKLKINRQKKFTEKQNI